MLREGTSALAHRLQEAMDALSSSDVRARLQDALDDLYPDRYPWLIDYFGDAASGDCVYCVAGEYAIAPYEISKAGDATNATIGKGAPVQPRTVYDPVPNDADWVAAIESLDPLDRPLGKIPGVLRMLRERFLPASERNTAPAADFAGKGKSFPILKAEDVDAAFRSLGRAGKENYSAATIKANIVKIANRKGFALPAHAAESATVEAAVNEFVALREGAVAQDGMTLLKLIAPGKGSSGHYSEAVLKRDGPKVFRAGTKNFWNHQTQAEESERPEGSLDDLASVLTEDAYYADGPKGPGLYAKAKVYEHYRRPIDDMAKDIGVSIRATGKAREGTLPDGSTGRVIEELTRAISVDYVTTPGAGGQVVSLFESARVRQSDREENTEMNEAEIKKMIEAGIVAAMAPTDTKIKGLEGDNRKLRERVAVAEAATQVDALLGAVDVLEGIKSRVKGRILAGVLPISESGDLDLVKLKALVEAEAKSESEYVAKLVEGSGLKVAGMGSADPTKAADLTAEDFEKQMVESYMREGKTKEQAERMARIGKAA